MDLNINTFTYYSKIMLGNKCKFLVALFLSYG